MGAIDFAKRHFEELDPDPIEVPQWRDDDNAPMKIYRTPCTLAEKSRILKKLGPNQNDLEGLAFALILKARDENGQKLFTIKDKHDLMHNVDPDVLSMIVKELMQNEEDADLEKNNQGPGLSLFVRTGGTPSQNG